MSDTAGSKSSTSTGTTLVQIVAGVVVGMLTLYLSGVLMSLVNLGSSPVRFLAGLALALLAGVAVFVGWRWFTLGLSAAVVNLALVAFVTLSGISSPSAELSWADVFVAMVVGAGSVFAPMIGVVLASSSVVGRLPATRRSE